MVDNVDADENAALQTEVAALRAQKDAAEAKVVALEAEKLEISAKPNRIKYPDVKEWDGQRALDPFLQSCNEFLEGYEDSEKLKYLVSRCVGHPQDHIRDQRDLNRKAGKAYTYEHAKESLKGVFWTVYPRVESHRQVVVEGVKQGDRTVKQYVQYIGSHLAKINSTEEDKRTYLLTGLADEQFRQTCLVTYGRKGDEATVSSLQQHILALDGFANTYRSGKGAGQSAKGVTVQGKGKGKGAGLGAQGGVQKPKPKAQGKPAHAKNQSPLDRQRLAKERRCFACEEVGHTQRDSKRCTLHPDYEANKGLAGMQVDPKN